MRLPINAQNVAETVHALAVANNVSDEQMAAFIYRNLYHPAQPRRLSERIHYHSTAITHLAEQL